MDKREIISFLKTAHNLEQVLPFLPYLKELDLSNREYAILIERLCRNFESFSLFYQKQYFLLYQLLDHMKQKNAALQNFFKIHFLYPIIKNDLYPYIESVVQLLNLNFANFTYHGFGSSNFTFFTDHFVLKLGNRRVTFDYPTFYRMNDLCIQKKFVLENQEAIYLEICPRGKKITLTKEDKKDIDMDFFQAGLILTDPNYDDNFALFEDDIFIPYQDIDGKHKKIELPYSRTFQKKKIKLVDLDYIYERNQKDIVWAPKL